MKELAWKVFRFMMEISKNYPIKLEKKPSEWVITINVKEAKDEKEAIRATF